VVDLASFLVGEIASVSAPFRAFILGRQTANEFAAAEAFHPSPARTTDAARLAPSPANAVHGAAPGTHGSRAFHPARLTEIEVSRNCGDRARGFKTVLVSEGHPPCIDWWWPPDPTIGWGETFVHELHHLLRAIAEDGEVAPYGATFEDGYRAVEVCDAIVR